MDPKWATPFDWLSDVAREWDAPRLYQELMTLAQRLDSDTLQDEFQTEMDKDGYFSQERCAD